MSTRQEIQVGLDLIRFTNIANDLFDTASNMAKFLVYKNETMTGENARELTQEEVKTNVEAASVNINRYLDKIETFIENNPKEASNGLSALGVNVADISQDVSGMRVHSEKIKEDAEKVEVREDLTAIAEYIDTNIPKLTLARKG